MMDKFTAYLNAITPLSEPASEDLRESMVRVELRKNQLLLRQGQICRYLYFVDAGLLRQLYFAEDKEITDYFAYEQKLVGGIGSFFSKMPSQKIIEAIEPSELLAISFDHLQKIFDKHHDVERVGRLIAIDAFIAMEQRIYSLQFHSAKKRYVDFCESNPNLLQRVPLGHLASYLGVTQVTLSRIRSGN